MLTTDIPSDRNYIISEINSMRKEGLREFIADLFFPNRCPFCGRVINYRYYACGECVENAEWASDMFQHDDRVFDYVIYPAVYAESARNAVLSLKYKNNMNAAAVFAFAVYKILETNNYDDFDYIVPAPMSIRKKRKRGYNQAEVFASELSSLLDIPVINDMLVHNHSFKSQHSRNSAERAEAVNREIVLAENAESCKGAKILLVDDIMTTGSTLNRCAELILENGAEKVCAAVCCATELF